MNISELLTAIVPTSCSVGAIVFVAKSIIKTVKSIKDSNKTLILKAKENDKLIGKTNEAVVEIRNDVNDVVVNLKEQLDKQNSIITKLKDEIAETRRENTNLQSVKKELEQIKQQLAQQLLNEECKN